MERGKAQNRSQLTLEMAGPRITASRFRKGVNAFLDLVEEVAKEFSGASRSVEWVVSVSAGSARISVEAEPVTLASTEVPNLLDAIETGLRTVEAGSDRPRYFTDNALTDARTLASLVDEKERELDLVRVWRHGKASRVTSQTLANVDSILGTESKDWGSVEGRLQGVLSHKGFKIWVVDPINDKAIQCFFSAELLEEMVNAFGKRVSVAGLVRYRRDGEIKSVQVEEFEVFPEAETLPSFEDVYGILRGID
jgi:hypothetical protein